MAGITLATFLTACGGQGPVATGGPPPQPFLPHVEPDPSLADLLEASLVGQYALHKTVVDLLQVPLFGQSESTTTSLGLATLRRGGDGFVWSERGCQVKSQSTGGVSSTIGDAIPRSVPPQARPLLLQQDGEVIRWQRPETITLLGVNLDDASGEPLPTTAEDPRVWDQDGDGKPGITVRISGLLSGDIYMVQRQTATYTGTLQEEGRLEGYVVEAVEDSVLGATNALLNKNLPRQQHADPERSRVQLRRLAPGYDCDRLVQEAPTLFP
jgi:hypothetical protein